MALGLRFAAGPGRPGQTEVRATFYASTMLVLCFDHV